LRLLEPEALAIQIVEALIVARPNIARKEKPGPGADIGRLGVVAPRGRG
jgi:hypothetical protein